MNRGDQNPPGRSRLAERLGRWPSPPAVWSHLKSRSLLSDFFFVHLGVATLLGVLATSGLWWTSNWVIEENLRKWAVQWVDRLDALGAPLYVAVDEEEFERVREYVESFPEIAFVRYYSPDGELFHEEQSASDLPVLPPLQREDFDELIRASEGPDRYRLDDSIQSGEVFRASTSLWAQSILADGLIGFDPEMGGKEERELLGFVELGLDFEHYRATMTRWVLQWSLGILIGLFCLAVVGLIGFRRALAPLRSLQEPLSRLARGDLEVPVEGGGHTELLAINDALANTINALHERDRKLREAANYDALTGLMGRRGLEESLEAELARIHQGGGSGALLFIDLDQFKYINDTAGHAAGDRLLVRVASLFSDATGDDGGVFRYGGDEFVILCCDVDAEEATSLASAIVEAMREIQFVEDGRAFNVRCSIGIALIGPYSAKPEEVLAQADLACHEAKGQGRNRFQLFRGTGEERGKSASDIGWSARIREALDSDGFSLRYQPIVSVEDGTATIYEVLLRMRGHGRKVIPPGAFLPAADRFGLMGELDYWVIRSAFAKLADVRQTRPDIVFALNLSGIVLSDDRLVAYVAEQLANFGLPGSAIIFEITEQVAVQHVDDANKVMAELIAMGCRFSLDDFGAGFSSFNYLKQLPVSFIKIDGAFIENLAQDPADRAIVKSIAQIARTVGTQTVAEFVRNAETLEILREIGIDYAQGFHLGRPRVDLRRERELVS